MGRLLGPALACVGAFLLTAAAMLRWYVAPLATQLPLAPNVTVTLAGPGSAYDPSRATSVAGQLQEQLIVRGDPAAGSRRLAVWAVQRRLVRADASILVRLDSERFAVDRRSAVAVACCGQRPGPGGLRYVFPPGVGRVSIPLYEPLTGRTAPARYAGEDTLAGLPTYRFEQAVPDSDLGLGRLPGAPSLAATRFDQVRERAEGARTLWVEPVTGLVVGARERWREWALLPGGRVVTLLDVDLRTDRRSEQRLAAAALARRGRIATLRDTAPLILVVAGLVVPAGWVGYRIVAVLQHSVAGRSATVRLR